MTRRLDLLFLLALFLPPVFGCQSSARDADRASGAVQAGISDHPDYAGLARSYAEAMLAEGRDNYGSVHAPIFATMLDRRSMQLLDRPKETVPFQRSVHGVRNIDRSYNAANPDNHAALFELLYTLTHDTGQSRYAAAADSALQWWFDNAQHPETGLMPWGEHTAWRLDKERPTRHKDNEWADLKHELHSYWPLWDDLFRVDRDAAVRYADALWEHHVYDKETGLHAHQTRYDTYAPDEGFVFPRIGGTMVYVWSLAYAHAEDDETKRRMLSHIHRIARAEHSRRDSSGAIYRLHPQRDSGPIDGVKPNQTIQGISEAYRGLDLPLPDSTKTLIRDWGSTSDDIIIEYLTSQKNGLMMRLDSVGLAKKTSGETLWCNRYSGAAPIARWGNRAVLRYRQTEREGYYRFARWVADQYVGSEPACSAYPLWPNALAEAIEILLHAHDLTGELRYLHEADRLGRRATSLFLDETSPLPKVFAQGPDHYEAITGGPELMYSIYKLGRKLE